MALEFFILIIIFAFSSRLYSQTSSTLFENIYIKSFRTLSPGYVSAFFRSTLLSMLSIRNHGMNFMALSFLNSGIIQSRQALGLLSGSYLGVCLAVGVLQIGHPIVLVALVVTLLVLSFLSGTAQFFRISKLFFYFILILVSYSGIITVLNKISLSYFSFPLRMLRRICT